MKNILPLLTLVALLNFPAALSSFAQGDRLLPATFQPGKEYQVRTEQHMVTSLGPLAGAAGGDGKQVVDMTIDVTARCTAIPDKPGHREVKTSLSAVKMKMTMSGLEMSYDSSEPGSENTMLGQGFKGVIGQEFTMILDENDEVVEVSGAENLGGGGANNPMAQQFGKDQLREMVLPSMATGIPDEGVTVGEEWPFDMEVSLGQMGDVKANYEFEYLRNEEIEGNNCAVLEYSAGVSMNLTGGAAEGLPDTSISSDDSKMKGTLIMDRGLRFPRSGEMEASMTIQMKNPVNPSEDLALPVEQNVKFTLISVSDI